MSGKTKRSCRSCGCGVAAHRKQRHCAHCARITKAQRRYLQKQMRKQE